MARLFLTDSKKFPLTVSVEDSVGEGGVNRRLDVLLVQFMLKVIDENEAKNPWLKQRPSEPLEIDGRYGGMTREYIDLFQQQYTKFKLARDRRVDPYVRGGWWGPVTRVFMTMAAINVAYLEAEGATALHTMTEHGWFPEELRPTLQIAQFH